jgi:hypothetical protein
MMSVVGSKKVMSVVGFKKVYKDMQDLVNSVGEKKDVSFMAEGMNTCGALWATWEKNKKIYISRVPDFFAILNNVMRMLEKEAALRKEPYVTNVRYLLDFLTYVFEAVQQYTDMKDPAKLFDFVQGLCCLYKSKDLQEAMKRAKAAKVKTTLTPQAEMPGGNVRIASLLRDLRDLRA